MSTSRDYAELDPRSFRRWLRQRHRRIEPERSVLHKDFQPPPNDAEEARIKAQSERAWRLARLGR
ncbi:MAG: hypothetical protein ACYCUI_15255 [Vulcanimicrobiaceae bacterium]